MFQHRERREVVLRIQLDESGAAGLTVADAPVGPSPPLTSHFGEGAFASSMSRSSRPLDPPREGAGDSDGGQGQEADMGRFFYRWGGELAAVMTRLRGRYGGDLDQFILHLVFMLAQLDSQNTAALARAKGAGSVVVRVCELNAQSLSDITAIPRESVRRKLTSLEAAGFIVRTDGGRYTLAEGSDVRGFFHDLAPLFWAGAKAPAG